MGRPSFVPDADQRKLVKALAAYGVPREQIALQILTSAGNPISESTLGAKFPNELKQAKAQLIGDAANWVVTHMRGRPAEYDAKGKIIRKEIPPNLTAATFLLESQGKEWGWSKSPQAEKPGDNPLAMGPYDLSKLSDAEIRAFRSLALKASVQPATAVQKAA